VGEENSLAMSLGGTPTSVHTTQTPRTLCTRCTDHLLRPERELGIGLCLPPAAGIRHAISFLCLSFLSCYMDGSPCPESLRGAVMEKRLGSKSESGSEGGLHPRRAEKGCIFLV
jgi:hypothetical protein